MILQEKHDKHESTLDVVLQAHSQFSDRDLNISAFQQEYLRIPTYSLHT